MNIMDYYKILNVSETSTKEEIKSAYRKLAAKHHPDRGGDTARFQEIQSAYDVLGDPEKRQEYDHQRKNQYSNFPFTDFGNPQPDDFFGQFGFADSFFNFSRARKNPDIKTSATIDLRETLDDSTKYISLRTKNNENKTLQVKIPRGIKSGTVMKFGGGGESIFPNMPPGDLYLTINVLDDPSFKSVGLDLEHDLHIDCFDAILGCEVEITTLSGKTFLIKIPENTQQFTKFKIPGEGLYEFQKDVKGNLYIKTNIKIPSNLTTEQLMLIKQIKTLQ
jgi:DnaJ-class molecular chaperone